MSDPSSSEPTKPRQRGSDWLWLSLAILTAAGLFAAAFFLPVRNRIVPVTGGAGISPERMSEIEHRVETLDARVTALEAQLANAPQVASPTPANEAASHVAPAASDLAHVQSDLAQLAATLGGLQDQIKQIGATAHAVTQGALSKMVAFVQLREAAVSDHGFATELEAMRAAAKDDPALKEPLDKLALYAEKGAPGIALLREELAEQAGAVDVAAAKAGAQNWWERILAEFRGLVLIRPLHSGSTEDDTLDAMKADLAQDDLTGALSAMKNLPPEAQQVLSDWQKQAEARLTIMESLQTIASRLVADANSPAQGTP